MIRKKNICINYMADNHYQDSETSIVLPKGDFENFEFTDQIDQCLQMIL